MAYPFQKAIRYKEFLLQLQSFGVEVKSSQSPVKDGQNKIPYLSYSSQGGVRYYPLTFSNEEEFVQWPVVRAVCMNLRLDPAKFGLTVEPKALEDTP